MEYPLLNYLRALPKSLYFNLRYLPFSQAIRLPILLYKAEFVALKGRVSIDAPQIRFGMIKLGFRNVPLFPNTGIVFENRGGDVIFSGEASIGNASALSIGAEAGLYFGADFSATALKVVAFEYIVFADRVRIGWDCLVTDTDFHTLTRDDGTHTRGHAATLISEDTWIGMRCTLLKGTILPPQTVVSAHSKLTGRYDIPPRSLLSGNPATLIKTGIYRNMSDDAITYQSPALTDE